MNGIDISSAQAGLDLSRIPFDFALIKATQGTGYTNPYCVGHVEQAASLGKSVGVYHYIGGGNAKGEAQFFVNSIRNWVGKHVIAVDWEQYQNSAWGNQSYLETVVSEIIRLTGVHPLIYAQQSVYGMISAVGRKYDCGLWVAQYASMEITGYQDSPWNEGAYDCAIRQYSSVGRLPGYGGNLDLDKFYGDRNTWNAYAKGTGASNIPAPAPSSNANVHYALHVLGGSWLSEVTNFGSGEDGFAGLPNHKHDLLYAKVDTGLLKYRVHTARSGWLPWVSQGNPNDTVTGCAGNPGEPIDGVQFYYVTPEGEPLKQAWYRSQTTARAGWLPVCCDDGTSVKGFDGWAGILGEPLDRLQVKVNDGNPF